MINKVLLSNERDDQDEPVELAAVAKVVGDSLMYLRYAALFHLPSRFVEESACQAFLCCCGRGRDMETMPSKSSWIYA